MSTNTITTTWKEKMLFESDNPSGHSLLIDNPEEEGGLDISYRPKALMLSSLAGCSGLDVVSLLKKMRVNVDDFKIVCNGHTVKSTQSVKYLDLTIDNSLSGEKKCKQYCK